MEDTKENPIDNSSTKNKLLELDKQRLKLEKEILEITNYLCQDGFPGVEKSLIDEEGFPIPGIDHYEIRRARNQLIRTQNDHKNMMLLIESEMIKYFNTEKENRQVEKDNRIILKEDNKHLVQVFEDDDVSKIKTNIPKIPFCYIQSVLENSPAYIAGFREGDAVINFGGINHLHGNPLEKISTVVKSSINQEVFIEVIHKNDLNTTKLKLVPKTWEGNGVLGCKLVIKLEN
jgi:26S proteasome non-ATPase regulatory subunit 9